MGLKELIHPLSHSFSFAGEASRDWRLSGRKATGKLAEIIQRANIDREAIQAQTLAAKLDTYETIDRMIERADARRIVILRELDRHRETLARRLKEAAAEIEAEELCVCDPGMTEAAA